MHTLIVWLLQHKNQHFYAGDKEKKTPGEKINLAVVVTWCRLRGLTQAAEIKGGWLVFRKEDGGETTTVFIPFNPLFIYSELYVCIASFLSRFCCSINLALVWKHHNTDVLKQNKTQSSSQTGIKCGGVLFLFIYANKNMSFSLFAVLFAQSNLLFSMLILFFFCNPL